MTTVKVVLNRQEYVILQKQWLVFDLRSSSDEWLATYECTQQETYALIAQTNATTPIPTLSDLLIVFAEKCKFSHSERLKKWAINLDRNFSEEHKDAPVNEEVMIRLANEC